MRATQFYLVLLVAALLTGCYSLPEPQLPARVALPTIGDKEKSRMKTFPQGKGVHAAIVLSENFKKQIKYSEDYIEYLHSFSSSSGDVKPILGAREFLVDPGFMPRWLYKTLGRYFEYVTVHDDRESAEKTNPDVYVVADWYYFQG